jgi:hypothetical protein
MKTEKYVGIDSTNLTVAEVRRGRLVIRQQVITFEYNKQKDEDQPIASEVEINLSREQLKTIVESELFKDFLGVK